MHIICMMYNNYLVLYMNILTIKRVNVCRTKENATFCERSGRFILKKTSAK